MSDSQPPDAAGPRSYNRSRRGPGWLELVLLVSLLLIALSQRLTDLEGPRSSFPDLFDEGIRAEQLLLMANGYRPFKDIYVSQGLLLLPILYPFYQLGGETLGAIRLGTGLLSVLGVVGIWWSARQVSGAVGGLAAAMLLVASPAYLEGSRLALAEVPSLVPCCWAIGCAIRWLRGGSTRWLYATALLATVGVLVKPMVIGVAAPLLLAVLLRKGVRPGQVMAALALSAGLVIVLVLVSGPAEVWQQMVEYRRGAREATAWDPRRNFKLIVVEPVRQQPGLFVLGAVSAVLLLWHDWRRGLVCLAWPVAVIALLVTYYPLHPKHLVNIYPPLVLLGGAGIGRAARLAREDVSAGRWSRYLAVGTAAVLAAIPFGALSGGGDSRSDYEEADTDLNVYDSATSGSIRLLTDSRAFIITDHPYLAALARRLVPPSLVDPSRGRTRAGVLSGDDVLREAAAYDVQAVVVWADRLRRLPGVPAWLDRDFVTGHSFGNRSVKSPRGAKDRTIYLRRDSDFAAQRAALESSLLWQERVNFEGRLQLLGAGLDRQEMKANGTDQITLTVGLLALAPLTVDYHITIQLVDPQGEIRHEQEHDVDGGARGTSTWQPGRWLFRTFAIQPERSAPAGEYRLDVALVDPKPGTTLDATVEPGGRQFVANREGVVTIARVTVR